MTGVAGLVGVLIVAAAALNVFGGSPFVGLLEPGYVTSNTLASDRTIGKADAPVTLDFYSDFQCPACGSFTRTVYPSLINDLVTTGKVKVVYKDFIIIDSKAPGGGGHESLDAATAARCAADQGQFWPYHDWLFANQQGENTGHFTKALFDAIASRLNLDRGKFDSCYDGAQARAAVQAEDAQGRAISFIDAAGKPTSGLQHTPTLIINGREINASLDAITAAVNGTASPGASASASAPPAPSSAAPSSAAPSASASPSASAAASASGSTAP